MLTRLGETFVPFASFIAIKLITVLITKIALAKLLENALNENETFQNFILLIERSVQCSNIKSF